MLYIKSNFTGQKTLWKVFWLDGTLFGVVAGAMAAFVTNLAAVTAPVSSIWIGPFIMVAWLIWVVCGMWTCAFNSSWAGWAYVLRGYVIIVLGAIAIAGGRFLLSMNS